jgi:hypothetical protein
MRCWLFNFVLNVHIRWEHNDLNDSSYGELQDFEHFVQYNIKILLGDCIAELESEEIFKPTFGNESLHLDSNDNGFRIVNLLAS